ncbi:MAG: hypothetical protein J7498_09200 [Sphingobium sp.]|nr:hypothetical protein [Sphingobium sp.]
MMPTALRRMLPYFGAVLALAATILWIDRFGYRRAMAERDARDAKLLGQIRIELRGSEQRLAISIASIEGDYEAVRRSLLRTGAALPPIILKEAAHDPRLSDPALGLSPGLLDAVNRARAAGACAAAAAGRIDCALPVPGTVAEPGAR